MLVIHRIGIFSLAKFFGILFALMGLLFGLLFSATSLLAGGILGKVLSSSGYNSGTVSTLVGVGACIFFPIIHAILGFIGGIITAVIANIALAISGGLEFQTKS